MLNDEALTREELIHKLEVLPEDQLPDLAHFLEQLETERDQQHAPKSVMDFAGSWEDMGEKEFENMMAESCQRREQNLFPST